MKDVVCPASVELEKLFKDKSGARKPTLALKLLKHLQLHNTEDLCCTHVALFAMPPNEAELKILSLAMKTVGEMLVPPEVWNTLKTTKLGKVQIPLLRRIIRRANQQYNA